MTSAAAAIGLAVLVAPPGAAHAGARPAMPRAAARPASLESAALRASIRPAGLSARTGWRHRPGQLLLDDEFTGPAGTPAPSYFNHETGSGGWGNQELEDYTASTANSSLDGAGHLAITAQKTATGYTSARLDTLGTFSFTYGLAEADIKVTSGQGLWPAFWMMGTDYPSVGWPACGEIDAMETLDNAPTTLYGSVHEVAATGGAEVNGGGTANSSTPFSAGYHVYGIDRQPGNITFLLDGKAYRTITPADMPPGASGLFTGPMFLLLNLAVGGNWPGSPDATTSFPATMDVDWLRVYSS